MSGSGSRDPGSGVVVRRGRGTRDRLQHGATKARGTHGGSRVVAAIHACRGALRARRRGRKRQTRIACVTERLASDVFSPPSPPYGRRPGRRSGQVTPHQRSGRTAPPNGTGRRLGATARSASGTHVRDPACRGWCQVCEGTCEQPHIQGCSQVASHACHAAEGRPRTARPRQARVASSQPVLSVRPPSPRGFVLKLLASGCRHLES